MENMNQNSQNPDSRELLKSQGRTYVQKSKKLEDAKSSSYLFIVFGVVGLLLILAVWLDFLPINMAFYMKILYTVVLGALFIVFIIVGIYYTHRIKILASETSTEEQQTAEIIQYVTGTYPLEKLDEMILADSLPMEQLYFERYEQIAAIIREKYQIQDDNYLDYLIEKIYQIYSPEE